MRFVKESVVGARPERVFAFHELPDALARLTPPWERSRLLEHAQSLRAGERTVLETRVLGLIPVRWVAEHTAYDPPRMFEDVQVEGPFRRWRHRHLIEAHPRGALLRDEIEYEPPLGPLGRILAPLLVVPRLWRVFEYRHRVTREWCEQGEGGQTDIKVMNGTTEDGAMNRTRGFIILGASLALLLGMVFLKARASNNSGDDDE